MRVSSRSSLLDTMARHWWAFVARGVLAVLFGIAAIVWPALTFQVLLVLFGVFAIVDGIVSIVGGLQSAGRTRWTSLLAGVVSVVIGVGVFLWPGVTALALVYFIAAWAILTGIMEVAGAIALRAEIEDEWLLAIAGVLSVVIGLYLAAFPGSGALALTLVIGAYAIGFGVLLVIAGIRLRSWQGGTDRSDTEAGATA
jgi:uncharacterized membrane protein HdeD (DUF308 family)